MTRHKARAPGPRPKRGENPPKTEGLTNSGPAQAPQAVAQAAPGDLGSNALWLLPTSSGEPWLVPQEPDAARLVKTLAGTPPVFVIPTHHSLSAAGSAERFGPVLDKRWEAQLQDSIFEFAKRLLLGVAWVAVGLAGLRIPGEIKFLDEILLLLGLGFLFYTFVRYGKAAWNWSRWRRQAQGTFRRATQVTSPLLDRLSQALQLRKNLPVEERGRQPDLELLDRDGYLALIRAGITLPKELSILGHAVEAHVVQAEEKTGKLSMSELAQRAGIDTSTALFYLDLVSAAKQIGTEME